MNRKILEEDQQYGRGSSDSTIFSYMMSKIPRLFLSVAGIAAFMYLFTYLINSATSKIGGKYKFEIKGAGEVS